MSLHFTIEIPDVDEYFFIQWKPKLLSALFHSGRIELLRIKSIRDKPDFLKVYTDFAKFGYISCLYSDDCIC